MTDLQAQYLLLYLGISAHLSIVFFASFRACRKTIRCLIIPLCLPDANGSIRLFQKSTICMPFIRRESGCCPSGSGSQASTGILHPQRMQLLFLATAPPMSLRSDSARPRGKRSCITSHLRDPQVCTRLPPRYNKAVFRSEQYQGGADEGRR